MSNKNLYSAMMAKNTKDATMLDIGANEGGWTNIMSRYPNFEIHAFEPFPKLVEKMKERFKDEPRIKVFLNGVSDSEFTDDGFTVFEAWTIGKQGEVPMQDSLGAREIVGGETISIDFITIDKHVIRKMIENIMFIKIDVDGYEFRVLKGAYNTIQIFRPLIWIELAYMMRKIGDDIYAFCDLVYDSLKYSMWTDRLVKMSKEDVLDSLKSDRSYDVAMIPQEYDVNTLDFQI